MDRGPQGETFEQMIARLDREKRDRIARIDLAFRQSPAVIEETKDGRKYLLILTGEMSTPEEGKLRLTRFGEDGPHGHAVGNTIAKLAEDIYGAVRPASDEDVMAWTQAPAFVEGAKRVTFVQATNALSYALRGKRYEEFVEIYHIAHKALDDQGWDAGTAVLTKALTELGEPVKQNPAWSTHVIAINYDLLEDRVPPPWLPKLFDPRPGPRESMMVDMRELGCGKYGCVLPTLSPTIVMKVTTDDTEAEFASQVSPTLVAPICVEYHMVIDLAAKHDGRKVYLLWREAAQDVGQIKLVVREGELAETFINQQWDAAQEVYEALLKEKPPTAVAARIGAWLERVEQMARQTKVPELVPLAQGLLKVWQEQHVFIGDIHPGNIGMVTRDGISSWVITDPGHVAIINGD